MRLYIEDFENLQGQLYLLLDSRNQSDLNKWISSLQPADIALLIEETPSSDIKYKIFNSIDDHSAQLEVLSFLEGVAARQIAQLIKPEKLVRMIDQMAPDEAVDFLDELSDEVSQKVLSTLPLDSASELRELGRYEEGTAGSLITTDFIHCIETTTIGEILIHLRANAAEMETLDTGFILTSSQKIMGIFSLKEIFSGNEKDPISKYMQKEYLHAEVTDDVSEILQIFSRHSLSVLPVVDHTGVMKGIITADDMIGVAQEQSDEDFYHMVGTTGNPTERNILSRVRHRMPWLASTLLGGMCAGWILKIFAVTLTQYPILMTGLPFVIAMAGNVGVQSATIIVREFVAQDSTTAHLKKQIYSEISTAIANALVFSTITFVLILGLAYTQGWPMLPVALSISIGLFVAMCFAGFIGSTAPLVFKRLDIDPAISSGPIITVTTDIVGLAIYLGFASWVLNSAGIETLSL